MLEVGTAVGAGGHFGQQDLQCVTARQSGMLDQVDLTHSAGAPSDDPVVSCPCPVAFTASW